MIALAHNRVMETIKGCLTESWKKKSVEQESWWQTPINSMTGLGLTAPEHGNLIPDGLCYFRGSNRIVLVEIARTSEFTGEGSSLANRRQAGKGHGLSAKTGQVDGYTETVNPGPEETRPHRRLGTEDYGNNRNSETTIEPWMPQRAIQEGPLCQA
mmetsp:Transcript_17383/g.57551  ORF Transcript_17383/g.57551 Transcript_17383/m.57551 type:complete len:156 (-) Transcript_17383:67-534(-)